MADRSKREEVVFAVAVVVMAVADVAVVVVNAVVFVLVTGVSSLAQTP